MLLGSPCVQPIWEREQLERLGKVGAVLQPIDVRLSLINLSSRVESLGIFMISSSLNDAWSGKRGKLNRLAKLAGSLRPRMG